MNEAHLHLIINHFPITLPIVGIIVMIIGLLSKSIAVKRTAYVLFIIGSLTSIVAVNSGEGAEEIVEKMTGVSENYIETHEEAAELFSILSYILGGISLLGLWLSFKQNKFSNTISIVTLLFAFVALYFGQRAGTTGGEIRHAEIRSESNLPDYQKKQSEEDDD